MCACSCETGRDPSFVGRDVRSTRLLRMNAGRDGQALGDRVVQWLRSVVIDRRSVMVASSQEWNRDQVKALGSKVLVWRIRVDPFVIRDS